MATSQLMPAQYFHWQSIKGFENVQSLGQESQSVLSPDTRSRVASLQEVTGFCWSQAVFEATAWWARGFSASSYCCLPRTLHEERWFIFEMLKSIWKRSLSFSVQSSSALAVPDFHLISIKASDRWRWMNRKMISTGNLANTHIPRGLC